MRQYVNIFDVANEAGVSIATVSRVLSGSAGVREATRKKVLEAARRLDYRPNMLATGLSQRKTRTLGVVLPMIDHPFYSTLYMAAQRRAMELGYFTVLFQIELGSERITREMVDHLIGRRLDGIVASGDMLKSADFDEGGSSLLEIGRYMPLAVVNSPVPLNCPCLSSDLEGACRTAIDHLRALGHERIALLGGNGYESFANTREHAYLEYMRKRGLEQYIYPYTLGGTAQEGAACVKWLLENFTGARRPTALFAFNDLVALGAIRQMRLMGLSLPHDMALVSCDNQFFSPYTEPPLTTIDLHAQKLGRKSVEILLAERSKLGMEILPSTLIVRASCGTPASCRGDSDAEG